MRPIKAIFMLSACPLFAQASSGVSPTAIPKLEELPKAARWRWVEDKEISKLKQIAAKSHPTKMDAESLLNAYMALSSSYGGTAYIGSSKDRGGDWAFWLSGCLGPAQTTDSPHATVNKSNGTLSIPSQEVSLLPKDLVRFILKHRSKNL
jgi:hypothetical protein